MARRPVAALCLLTLLTQTLAPALAAADGNPFSRVPDAVVPAEPVNPPPSSPSECLLPFGALCLPHAQPRLVCEPAPAQAPESFERLIRDYIFAHKASDMSRSIHLISEIAISVFKNPGSEDYLAKLKYIDEQSAYAPDAMFDIGKTLQNRWEAAYGMQLSQKIQAGISDENAEDSLAEQRNGHRANGRRAGGIIGGLVALTALGILMLRHPTATPRYFTVFRALTRGARSEAAVLATTVGTIAGIAVGGKAANAFSWFHERDLPLAPAHVMRLGIDRDELTPDDDLIVQAVVPALAGIAVGEGILLLTSGSGIVSNLAGVVRTVVTLNKAPNPAKINPAVLIGSIVVGFMAEALAGKGLDAWEYKQLKSAVRESRDAIELATQKGDTVLAYRASEALVANTLLLAAYSSKPITNAHIKFLQSLNAASEKFKDPNSPELKQKLEELVAKLTQDVNRALARLDQKSDADYQAFLALDVLEAADPGAMSQLSESAHGQLQTYLDLYLASPQGFKALNAADSQERFRQYIRGLRQAKTRELAQQLRDGQFVRHSGHTMLMSGALLRTTGLAYIQPQADFLMSEVAREEAMIHALSQPQSQNTIAGERI